MIGIAETVNDYLKSQLPDLPEIYTDIFPFAEGESLLSRHDPSTAVEKRFLDGSRFGAVNLSYTARAKDPKVCRDRLNSILNTLDIKELIQASEGMAFECEALTLPQFVTVDDKEQTIYTCAVRVEYTQEV